MGMHDLEGHDPVKAEIDGFVDGGHAAAGEHCADLVATVDNGANKASACRGLHPSESRCGEHAYSGVTRPCKLLIASPTRISILPRSSMTARPDSWTICPISESTWLRRSSPSR